MTIDLSKTPALRYVLFFSVGLILSPLLGISLNLSVVLLIISLLAIFFIKTEKLRDLCFIVCIVICGMLRFSLAENQHLDKRQILFEDKEKIIVVVSQKTTPYHLNSYIIMCREAGKKIKGTLYAKRDMPILYPGKSYRVSNLSSKVIEKQKNPYVFDYYRYATSKGISHSFKTGKLSHFDELGVAIPLRYTAYMIRTDISTRYLSVLGIEKGSLVNGLLLGLKSEIPTHFSDMFKSLGISHLLAVSGLHVGLIMMIVYQLLQALGLTRVPRVIAIILFLAFYCLLTGGSASVLRSSLMSSTLLFAPLLARKYHAMNAVASSALILLLVNPYALQDVGFQFSFSAVLGILIAYPKFRSWVDLKGKPALIKYIWDMLAVSMSAALFTAPVAMFYFNNLQLASMALNCLVIPLTTVCMVSAIICLPCLYLPSFISDLFLHALDLSLDVFRFVIRLASRSGMWTLGISSYYKAIFLGLFGIALTFIILEKRKHKVMVGLVCFLGSIIMFYTQSRPEFIVPVLEKGKCAIYRRGRNALLINTGAVKFGSNDYDKNIKAILEHFGVLNVVVMITEINKNKTGNIFRVKQDFRDCPLILPDSISGLEGRHSIVRKDSTINIAGKKINLHISEGKIALRIPFACDSLILHEDSIENYPIINIDRIREKPIHLRSFGKIKCEMD